MAQIWCGTWRDPMQGIWMIEFSKCASNKIFFLFLKIHDIFCICFTMNMFTIKIEYGRDKQ